MDADITVIIPTLNEASGIVRCLEQVVGKAGEVWVIDGGSTDATRQLAQAQGARVAIGSPGRARQMHLGVELSTESVLVFLHADTVLPTDWDLQVREASARAAWGRFDVYMLGSPGPVLRLIASMINLRSRLSGISTGDQVQFTTRRAYQEVGGFPDQPLMEDIELSRRLLRAKGRPICLHARVGVDARRWIKLGIWRTVFLMWELRLRYFFGADPRSLRRRYQDAR